MHGAMTEMVKHRKRGKPQLDRGDTTPERLNMAGEDTFTDDQRRRWMRDSPLERAYNRSVINGHQRAAGVKYRDHWFGAGFAGQLGSADLGHIHAGNIINFTLLAHSEQQVYDREEYREANQACGQIGAATLDHVVCLEMPLHVWGMMLGWPHKGSAIVAATEQLRTALNVLCRIWRI